MVGSAAADWVLIGPERTGSLDIRATLRTDDGATIFVQHYGRLELDASQGLEPPTTICVGPRFEAGDERYVWSTPGQHPREDLLLPAAATQPRSQDADSQAAVPTRWTPTGPPPAVTRIRCEKAASYASHQEARRPSPEQTVSTAARVPLAVIVNVSTATHFALVSPMVAVHGCDGAHIVANSHQMQ